MAYYKGIIDAHVGERAPHRSKIQFVEQLVPNYVPMQLSKTERRELEDYTDEMFATGRHLVLNFEC